MAKNSFIHLIEQNMNKFRQNFAKIKSFETFYENYNGNFYYVFLTYLEIFVIIKKILLY